MSDLPKSAIFHEEGPREGFQIEKRLYSVEERVALVDALSAAGLPQIQVGSFVSPKAVPTMADIAQVFGAIARRPGTRYTALWLNEAGYRKAAATPGVDLDGKILLYTTETFSRKAGRNSCLFLQEEGTRGTHIADSGPVGVKLLDDLLHVARRRHARHR